MKTKLLRQKVAYAVDQNAETVSKNVATAVTAGNTDLNAVATAINADGKKSVVFWPAAWVPKDNQDGGLAAAASKLEVGQVSKAVKTTSGDGYYYVKLVDKNETQIRYEYIQVPLTAFDAMLAKVGTDNKVVEYISIPSIEEQTQTEPTKQ
jgi:hypothetical protein